MKIIRTIIVTFCTLAITVTLCRAQQLVKIKRSEFKVVDVGFKEAWKAIKEGNILFSEGLGTYREARKNYLKAYRYNPTNAELNYMIGICYLFTDDKFESIKYLKKAYKNNPDVSSDIRFMLGRAYHLVLDFDNAMLEYNEYLQSLDPKEVPKVKLTIERLISECRNGKELVAEPKRTVVSNPGKAINSEYDDYNPVISKDESTMFFTSRRMHEEKSPRNPFDNKFYEDVYYSEFKGGAWNQAERFDTRINKKRNKANNAAIAISPDKNEIYLYVGKSNSGDIFSSYLNNGKWTPPRPISHKINSKYRETSLCFSSDENTMYFVSNDPKTSLGGADIYVSKKDPKGRWQEPENLGNIINTEFDEVAVNLSPNDSTLYFSSKGHKTMGGFDVFKTSLNETGLWSAPENMGYPINTPDDDVFYDEMSDGRTAYYSTIRESGLGGKDIYRIIFLGAEKEMLQSDENMEILGILQPYDNIFFTIPPKMEIDTSITMKGMITDSENEKPVIAKLELIDVEESKVIATSLSDANGNYKIKIPEPKQYGIEIVAKGYLLFLDAVNLIGESYENDVIRNFKLERVEVGARVVMKNIFFEFGKATLKPESYTQLDNVVKFMENNEGLRLEISGHTDNIGSLKTNMRLSESRAKSVVEYLIKKGISSNRLEYKGYAYTQPIAPNTSEQGRAQNRRVEFKVLSK